MKDEQFKRANEIAEEISALIELKKEVSKGQFPISIEIRYFNKWSKVEKAFSRSEWQQNLKDLIIVKCTARIDELEKEFKEL
jgi:trehalose-6-phosphate synthase